MSFWNAVAQFNLIKFGPEMKDALHLSADHKLDHVYIQNTDLFL